MERSRERKLPAGADHSQPANEAKGIVAELGAVAAGDGEERGKVLVQVLDRLLRELAHRGLLELDILSLHRDEGRLRDGDPPLGRFLCEVSQSVDG